MYNSAHVKCTNTSCLSSSVHVLTHQTVSVQWGILSLEHIVMINRSTGLLVVVQTRLVTTRKKITQFRQHQQYLVLGHIFPINFSHLLSAMQLRRYAQSVPIYFQSDSYRYTVCMCAVLMLVVGADYNQYLGTRSCLHQSY